MEPLSEEWRPVAGFDGYEVSSLGRVRSWRRRGTNPAPRETPIILRRGKGKSGYPVVTLRADNVPHTFAVHRLVLDAFVGPRPPGTECRHFPDRDVQNCRIDNLQWGTRAQNDADKDIHGTVPRGAKHGASVSPGKRVRGSRHWNTKLTPDKVEQVFRMNADGVTKLEIGRAVGISDTHVGRILRGEFWKHLRLNVLPDSSCTG